MRSRHELSRSPASCPSVDQCQRGAAMRKLALVLSVSLVLAAANAFAERHTLIVLSQDDHTLYRINPATGQTMQQCSVAGVPHDAIFSWDEKTLFVSVPDSGQV